MKNKSPARSIIGAESYDRCAYFFPGRRRLLGRVAIGKRVIAVIAHKSHAADCQARDATRCGRHQANLCVFPQVVPSVSLQLVQSPPGAFGSGSGISQDTEPRDAAATAPRTAATAASLSLLLRQALRHDAPSAFVPELRSCVLFRTRIRITLLKAFP